MPTNNKIDDERGDDDSEPVGSTTDANGVITLPETTVVGDPSASTEGDEPLEDDVIGNMIPGAIVGGVIEGAEGVVSAVLVELGKAFAEEVGSDADTDAKDAGVPAGAPPPDPESDGDDGDDKDPHREDHPVGSGGSETNDDPDASGDTTGQGLSDSIIGRIDAAARAGGIHHDEDGDGTGAGQIRNRQFSDDVLAAAARELEAIGEREGDGDGTGRGVDGPLVDRIRRAAEALIPDDAQGDGDGTGHSVGVPHLTPKQNDESGG